MISYNIALIIGLIIVFIIGYLIGKGTDINMYEAVVTGGGEDGYIIGEYRSAESACEGASLYLNDNPGSEISIIHNGVIVFTMTRR